MPFRLKQVGCEDTGSSMPLSRVSSVSDLDEVSSVASTAASRTGSVRNATVDRSIDQVAQRFSEQEAKKQIADLGATLLKRHDLLTKCRSLVERTLKKEQPTYLRFGVRFVGQVPDYIVREVLDHVFQTGDLAIWTNRDNESNQHLMFFILGVGPRTKLPQHEMEVNAFLLWCAGRYQCCGSLLKDAPITVDSFFSWEWNVGVITFVRDDYECKDDSEMTHVCVRDNPNMTAELPQGFKPIAGQIGVTWWLKSNFSVEECYLYNSRSGAKLPIEPLFHGDEAANMFPNLGLFKV